MSEWQPIETAPMNEEILVSDASWMAQAMFEEVDYSEFRGVPIYGWTYGSAIVDPTNFYPTHWMPLPEPPKVA